jgi:hypothetical protein
MGMSLGAVAENGHGLAVEPREIRVLVVDHGARTIPAAPGWLWTAARLASAG